MISSLLTARKHRDTYYVMVYVHAQRLRGRDGRWWGEITGGSIGADFQTPIRTRGPLPLFPPLSGHIERHSFHVYILP